MHASGPHDRTLLAAFSLGHLANDWAVGAIWLIAPAVAASMGLGAPEVGLLLALHGLGAALGYLPAGVIADRLAYCGPFLALTFLWVVIGYGVLELYAGVAGTQAGVANFAHLGGMVFGLLLILYWRGKLPIKPKRRSYY